MLKQNMVSLNEKKIFHTFGATNEGQPKSAVASHPSNVPSVMVVDTVAGLFFKGKDPGASIFFSLWAVGLRVFSGEGDKSI